MPKVIKTYGHNEGWSCAYRNWRAKSHCSQIHGYAPSFELGYEAADLDECHWVLDFGSLKPLKAYLKASFDHRLIVAQDDPQLDWFRQGAVLGLANIMLLEYVSCEMFAKLAYEAAQTILSESSDKDRVTVVYAKVSEHSGNAAIYP